MAELSDITLRYWAGARTAAGTDTEVFAAATIADALAAARRRRADPRFDRVLAVCSLLVDGVVVTAHDLTRPRHQATEVEVLPPFAGGSGRPRPPASASPLGAGGADPGHCRTPLVS